MRLGWAALCGVVLFVVSNAAADAPPAPKLPAPCTGAAQCLDKGDAARLGKDMEPDRGLAVRAYEEACRVGDARGCLEASRLYQRGWMFEVERKRDRAKELADEAQRKAPSCSQSEACVIGFDAQLLEFEQAHWPESMKSAGQQLLADAQKACDKWGEACEWVYAHVFDLGNRNYIERSSAETARDKAVAGLEALCKKSSTPSACYYAGRHARRDEQAAKHFEIACKASFKDSCWRYYESRFDSMKKDEFPALFKEALGKLEPLCETAPTQQCRELGEIFFIGVDEDGVKVAKDVGRGTKLIERACKAGDQPSCEGLGKMYNEGKFITANPTRAKELLGRACRLNEPEDQCKLCELFPNAEECQRRNAWLSATSCEIGDENACASVGDALRGVKGSSLRDHQRAARYYRRACDAAVKTACASLDEMCVAGNDVEASLCQQSLIHTDLFYEAEWQFRHTGEAKLDAGADVTKANDKVAGVDQPAAGGGGPGASFKRGSLDADLVVGIVLDRARQAAIQIVVDELQRAGGGRVAGYLRDLLGQAALLLGDKNTLRREKLTDLARTVVRALLASNLVNTLFPDPNELLTSSHYAEWAGKPWAPKWRGGDREKLRRYLTDWAYHLLGETKLFGGVAGASGVDKLPACPFSSGPGKEVCGWLVDNKKPNYEHLGALLHLNQFVDGLSLARVIRMEREVDLRRLVEAIGRSKSIANFTSTPGLNLQVWERDLVDGVDGRLRDLREQIDAIAKLADSGTYSGTPNLTDLQTIARSARRFLYDRGAAALLPREINAKLMFITNILLAPPTPGQPGAQVESDESKAMRLAGEAAAKLQTWDSATRVDLMTKVTDLRRRITNVRPSVTALARQIDEIRSTLRRLSRGNLAIDEIPLSGLSELNESLDAALGELKKLDEQLRQLFPGTRRTQVRFAISAVVRLRGFLSLMDRISRRAPLNQSIGELMASLKMLGSVRRGRFTAPLFDIVEPVIESLATHRPLDGDVLFSMIARARLDSLVTSLEADEKHRPCERDDGGTECWTVKVIHALQESVQRDGDMIRVDGGQFAKRLAIHGDDFRKKHKWGSFFHLTVGFGGMYSKDPPSTDEMTGEITIGKNRTVPVVAEQIGFGMASPTFFRDKLTFKIGVFGSGILYRMVLDSAESNAVALGGFMAIDIHNYVELFVAPAILLYPPAGDRTITPTLGVSAGLQVPLGAYLEKLTD